ncbi:MAG: hypothetical protein NXI22_06605 [bacterium]|nr:hypothetical protein [bacterium]
MSDANKNPFLDAKNALLLMRQLARLDEERGSNNTLDEILTEEERANGYASKVPLLNQAAFLAITYSTLVWLRESYFKDDPARTTLGKRVESIFDDPTLAIKTGPKAREIGKNNPTELVRRVRNSLGHASVEIEKRTFRFTDTNPRDHDDWAEIEMSWRTVGQLCESVIGAGNDLLYPEASGITNKALTSRAE